MNGVAIMTGIIATQGYGLHLSYHKVLPCRTRLVVASQVFVVRCLRINFLFPEFEKAMLWEFLQHLLGGLESDEVPKKMATTKNWKLRNR